MSTTKKILTIFGSTGNQGGSVIDAVLALPDLGSKYALRGITRDPSSEKSQALNKKGVEMVKAELDDLDSLKAAIKGSYGVFGVTDFWSIMDQHREIQQGKNIFEAAKSEGVKHVIFSSLPYASKLTDGELAHVQHFDSKAQVEEYIEANKGDGLIASFFQPAMFITFAKNQTRKIGETPTLSMPFEADIAWPLIDPRRDVGGYVMGLFEGGAEANGARVHGVSAWTTPKELVAAIGKEAGQEVVFKTLPPDVYAGFLPEAVREDLLQTMLLIGRYSYYGKGEEKNQAEHDKWLVKGASTISLEQWVHENGPWKF